MKSKPPTELAQKKTLAKRVMALKDIAQNTLEYEDAYNKLIEENTLEELEKLRQYFMKPSKLRIHERYWDKKISKDILKVPNGYLYSDWDAALDRPYNTTFVPK